MADITHFSQVKTDAVLTNFLLGYGPNNLIHRQVIPTVSVAKDTDKFYIWKDNGTNITGLETRRADRAPAAEVGFGVDYDTYTMEQHALKDFLEDGVVKNADSILSLREVAARNITDLLELKAEVTTKDLVFTQGNYASGNYTTLTTTDRWSQIGETNSDPQADILAAKAVVMKAARVVPNTLVIGYDGWNFLKTHSKAKDAVKYVAATGDGDMTKKVIANWLGVDNIIVGEATYNSAKEGQTPVPAFVWGTHAALVYIPSRPAINSPGWAYRFEPTHTPRTVSRYRPQELLGEWIEVNEKYSYKVCFNKAAYLFTNAFDVA